MRRVMQAGVQQKSGIGFTVLSSDQIESIDLGSLELLSKTGVFVEDKKVRLIYEQAGCDIDHDRRVVRIPPYVVREALRLAPPSVTLCGRDPANDIVLEQGRVSFLNFGEGLMVIDPWERRRRPAAKKDVGHIAKLVDALSDIDINESSVHPQDVPRDTLGLHMLEEQLHNTSKPFGYAPLTKVEADVGIEILGIAAGGSDALRRRPPVFFTACTVSPLKLIETATDAIIAAAKAGLPCNMCCIALAGGSAPVSTAGVLVLHNAEVLAAITLAELVSPGAPVIYGSSSSIMDLRYGIASVGCPEAGLINAGVAQIAQQHRLPSYVGGA